jgi:hypothetical protein
LVPESPRKAFGIVKKSAPGATALILNTIGAGLDTPGYPSGKLADYQVTGNDLTAGGELPIFPGDIGRRFRAERPPNP